MWGTQLQPELFQQVKNAPNTRPFFFRYRIEELLNRSPTLLVGVEFGSAGHVIVNIIIAQLSIYRNK